MKTPICWSSQLTLDGGRPSKIDRRWFDVLNSRPPTDVRLERCAYDINDATKVIQAVFEDVRVILVRALLHEGKKIS